MNFSLYFRGVKNIHTSILRSISVYSAKPIGVLEIHRNNSIFRESYLGSYFRGKLASASLKSRYLFIEKKVLGREDSNEAYTSKVGYRCTFIKPSSAPSSFAMRSLKSAMSLLESLETL